ncbi:hypothetical protein [Hoylesella timonensis]|uniref:hypothetical protein n=1 Tax=Hoylesella timonensis TaxID=386414 RepID=UPI000A4AEC9F|nr:hypothetical protein [Hoylesella timonensis]
MLIEFVLFYKNNSQNRKRSCPFRCKNKALLACLYHLILLCQWDRAVTPLSLSHYLHAFACLFAPNKGSLGMKEAFFISNFMGYDCNVVSNVLVVKKISKLVRASRILAEEVVSMLKCAVFLLKT